MRSAMLAPVRGLLVMLVALGACAGDDAGLEPDGGTPIDASPDAPDPSAALFAPDHLVEIAIELPAADWDEVRRQTRPSDLLVGADCQAGPFGSPFTSKLATVTIDGQRFSQVAVRKKGFLGSLDDDKPSLKLKLDEVVADQAIAGVKSLTLNNNRQDPSAIRQCLAFRVFAAAGVPAPRCNFAHVTVNGRDLGVFTHLEGVGKRLLARHFSDDGGRLYEGTLSDFRTGWLATFEPKTDEANPDRSDLEAVAAAAAVPDAQLEAALAPVVDVERFLTYWAVETLLEHGDGYASNTNNFFVYRDPTSGRFDFLPWGTDGVMGAPGTAPPSTVFFAHGVLARRLYQLPATRARLLAALDRVLTTAWDETALLAEIDRMAALLAPLRVGDPFAVGVDLAAELDGVRAFVRTRRARIAPAIAAPPAWTNPLRTSFCFIELGPLHATFATTFKTAEPPDVFAAGTGTLTGSLEGTPITSQRIGTNAAPSDDGRVEVQLFDLVSGTEVLVAVVRVPPAAMVAGATVPIEVFSSFVFRFNPVTGTGSVVGYLLGGQIQFTAAGTTDGAAVTGRWDSTVFSAPL